MAYTFPVSLDLLLALEALLSTCNVTRAAAQLGISQSAMSQKLRQLRESLDDPLFITAPHGLLPTARARAMEGPLRAALQDLSSALHAGADFDPATSTRHFRLGTDDLGEFVAMPAVVKRLAEVAPHLTFGMIGPPPDILRAMEEGQADILMWGGPPGFPQLRHRKVGTISFVVLAREGHPLARDGRISMEDYLAGEHLLVTRDGQFNGVIFDVLAPHVRRIRAHMSHYAPAPFLVAQSDLLFTCFSAFARSARPYVPFQVLPVPFVVPPIDLYMCWHPRAHNDPGHRWLREEVTAITQEIFREAP